MARKELAVAPRAITGKKVAQLRRQGIVPANIYGRNLPSVAVQLPTIELQKTLKASTVNEVIDLMVDGERAARPMIINHVQRDPLSSTILHADFYQVSLRERMRADVHIVVTGTSEAVATYGGVLIQSLDVLHIEALPLDIPTHIEVDVSALTELEMSIHVRELKLPESVIIHTDPDVVVVKIEAPRVAEVEEVAAPTTPEAAEAAASAAEAEAAP